MLDGWWELFAAALGGGATAKIIEFAYKEARILFSLRYVTARSISDSLEPLLKATDELVGKLRSLAEQDFLPVRSARKDFSDSEYASVVFLFVQFWAWIEVFRERSFNTDLGKSKVGRQLSAFLDCLESRRVRLIDRTAQRAIGECAIRDGRPINFVEFVKLSESDAHVRRWLAPFVDVIDHLDDSGKRQRLLRHAVILHAMIDTLDKRHSITKERPSTPNKLTRASWRDLEFRVFGVYLKFVKDRAKYIGPPKGRP